MNVSPQEICDNIRVNAGRNLPEVTAKAVCICASGPSLSDHIEHIRYRKALDFDVASMNGSHNHLIEHGIVPDLMFMVDSRPVNLPFLERANDHTTYVIASQCRPEIFDTLEGRKVKLWQVDNYEGAREAIQECAPRATIFGGAGNVGLSCLKPLFMMGYKRWHLFGFDGPTPSGKRHAFRQPQNDSDEVTEFVFDGEHFHGSPTMAEGASNFRTEYRRFAALGIEIEIYGWGLLPAMARKDCGARVVRNEETLAGDRRTGQVARAESGG